MVISLLLFISPILAWECGISTQPIPDAHVVKQNHRTKDGRILAEMEGIRIHIYNLGLDFPDGYEANEDKLLNNVLPRVLNWYSKIFSVIPIEGPINFGGFGYCIDFQIPQDIQDNGYDGADILVFLKGNNSVPDNEYWVARAGYCLRDSDTGRPIAGTFEMNNARYLEGLSWEDELSLVAHELAHILWFSSGLFQFYNTDSVTQQVTKRGKSFYQVKSPLALEQARKCFNSSCEINGIDLEEYGGTGTAGSHWDKLIVYKDFMNGDVGPTDTDYSCISFALAEDSGWYGVDYTLCDSLQWCEAVDCSIFSDACPDTSQKPWCEKDEGCVFSHYRVGYCAKGDYADPYMDSCPVIKAYSNTDCRNLDNTNFPASAARGEVYGYNSRCLEYQRNSTSDPDNYYQEQGCYEIDCSTKPAKIKIFGQELVCPVDGGQVTDIHEQLSYDRFFECPTYDQICGLNHCPNTCSLSGKCQENGTCQCYDGYGGYYCQTKCNSNCKNCEENQPTICTSCFGNQVVLGDNTCGCTEGEPDSEGNCPNACPKYCNECGDNKICIDCQYNLKTLDSGECGCPDEATLNEQTTPTCDCPSGFWYNEKECQELICNGVCKICSSPDVCTTCPDETFINNNGVCQCPDDLTEVGETCLADPCGNFCEVCDNTTCTNCVHSSFDLADGRCKCLEDQYQADNQCHNCPTYCTKCDSGTNCTGCVNNAFKNNSGVCQCNSSYQGQGEYCCDKRCNGCSANNSSQCTGCRDDATLDGSTCKCNGVNEMSADGVCCNPQCTNCTGTSNNCTGCKTGATLQSDKTCKCIEDYYTLNQTTQRCEVHACNPVCLTCDKHNKDLCLTCDTSSQYLSQGTCKCNTGFSWSPTSKSCIECVKFLTNNKFQAVFSTDYMKIYVNLSVSAQTDYIQNCQDAFAPATLSKLGSAVCSWENDKRFVVTLISGHDIGQEYLDLNDTNWVENSAGCNSITDLKVYLQFNSNILWPNFNLKYPSTYSKECSAEDFQIQILNLTGTGLQPFETQFEVNQLGSSIPGTNEWLPNKIIFDPNSSTLPAGNLSWSVYVKNFRNATFYWSGITTVITDEPAIGVNFQGGNTQTMNKGASATIFSSITFCDSALGDSYTPIYQWSFLEADSSSCFVDSSGILSNTSDHSKLIVKPSQIEAGCKYDFELQVTYNNSQATAKVTVVVESLPLQLIMNRGTSTVCNGAVFNLDASKSYDPDESNVQLEYLLSCQNSSVDFYQSTNTSNLEIGIGSLQSGLQYICKGKIWKGVAGYDGYRETEESFTILVQECGSTSIQVSTQSQRINPQKNVQIIPEITAVNGYSFLWSNVSCSKFIPSSPETGFYLQFAANGLPTCETCEIQLDATPPQGSSEPAMQVSVTLQMNCAPYMPSGTFSCNALSNYPGYVGCNASTIVDLENDTPLRYTYYVLWPFNGQWVWYVISQNVTCANMIIGFYGYVQSQMKIKVCDSLQTCAEFIDDFTVNGRRQLTSEDVLAEYNKSIRDPTNIVNQGTAAALSGSLSTQGIDDVAQTFMDYFKTYEDTDMVSHYDYCLSQSLALLSNIVISEQVAAQLLTFVNQISITVSYQTQFDFDQCIEFIDAINSLTHLPKIPVEMFEVNYQNLCMKNSLPNVQPMVISAPAKREVSLRQRVTQDYLSEHEFLLENATITYSTIQNKSIQVLDIDINIKYFDNEWKVTLSHQGSGILKDYELSLYDDGRVPQDELLDYRVQVTLNNLELQEDKTYECVHKDAIYKCLMVQHDLSTVEIDISALGEYTIREFVQQEEQKVSQSESEDCYTNLAPVIIMICLVSLSLIYSGVFIWYDYKNEEHNGMTKIQTEVTEQDENSQFKQQANSPTDVTNIIQPQIDQPQEESNVIQTEKLPFLQKFLQIHTLTACIYLKGFERIKKVLTFSTILLFEFLILGLILLKDLDEEGDSVTASEAFEDFSGTDFGYALTSCFAALPIAAGIHYLTRVNSSMLLNIIGCGLLTFLLLGSIGGIVALDVSFCHHVSGIWAVGGLVIGLLDVALIQTIIGVVGASIS